MTFNKAAEEVINCSQGLPAGNFTHGNCFRIEWLIVITRENNVLSFLDKNIKAAAQVTGSSDMNMATLAAVLKHAQVTDKLV